MQKKIITKTLKEYKETGLGLPYAIVIKNSAIARLDAKSGKIIAVKVPDFNNLIVNFILMRVMVANKLLPAEIKFFRKALGLTGKKFAEMINVTPETVSRWEAGANMEEKNERLLRLCVGYQCSGRVPCNTLFEPRHILQFGLKTQFEDGYQPCFVFERVRVIQDSEDEWRGHQAA